MKHFFKNHPDSILVMLTLLFLAVIAGSFFWGVNTVVDNVNGALTFTPGSQNAGFDLQTAAHLNTRGLVPQQ